MITFPFTQHFIFCYIRICFKRLSLPLIHIKLSSGCVNLSKYLSTVGILSIIFFLKKLPLKLSDLLRSELVALQASCIALGSKSVFTINLRILLVSVVLNWSCISWIQHLPLSWLILLFGQEIAHVASCVGGNVFWGFAFQKFLYVFSS